jgi:hypothetical protein
MSEKHQNKEQCCCIPRTRVIKLTIEGLGCECVCCETEKEESCCESNPKRSCCADTETEGRECC